MPVDPTQQAITDIKNVYQPPIDWMFYLTIVGSILLALLLLALVIYLVDKYLKSRKNKDIEPEPEPPSWGTGSKNQFIPITAVLMFTTASLYFS